MSRLDLSDDRVNKLALRIKMRKVANRFRHMDELFDLPELKLLYYHHHFYQLHRLKFYHQTEMNFLMIQLNDLSTLSSLILFSDKVKFFNDLVE